MARREKDVDMPRRGNFKGGMGQTSTTGGAKPKKTRGVATTEAVKKMKQKESSAPKPRAKPAEVKASSARKKANMKAGVGDMAVAMGSGPAISKVKSATNRYKPKSAAKRSVRDMDPTPKRGSAMPRASSPSSRKPLATGARSANQSGTGYKEGSIMDTLTRIRRGIYKPKRAAPPKAMSSKDRRKARTGR